MEEEREEVEEEREEEVEEEELEEEEQEEENEAHIYEEVNKGLNSTLIYLKCTTFFLD